MRSWRAYRANRVAQFIGFGSVALFLASQFFPENARSVMSEWINENVGVSALLFVLLMLLMIVPTLNLINWKCPRCGELFSYPARTRGACQSCGLTKFADPQAGDS